MGELEWDLFSSKFYLTGTEGSKNLREKKASGGGWVGRKAELCSRGAAFRAEMSKS